MMKYLVLAIVLMSCSQENSFRRSHYVLSHVMKFENEALDTIVDYENSPYTIDLIFSAHNFENIVFYNHDVMIANCPTGEAVKRPEEITGKYAVSRIVHFNRSDSLVLYDITDTVSMESISFHGAVVENFPFEGINYFRYVDEN